MQKVLDLIRWVLPIVKEDARCNRVCKTCIAVISALLAVAAFLPL